MYETMCPAYIWPYDSHQWAAFLEAGPKWGVINPMNGPGVYMPMYSDLVAQMAARGIRTAGYIATNYGNKSILDIKQEIARYREMYSVQDYFFDETQPAMPLSYFNSIHEFVRLYGGRTRCTWWNPGAGWNSLRVKYLMSKLGGSCWVTWEGPEWLYLQERPRALWFPNRQCHLVYGVSHQTAVEELIPCRFAYLTADDLPNPWDTWRGIP